MAILIDGKKIAQELQAECAGRALSLKARGIFPRLDVVRVGNDPASEQYANSRARDCESVGIESRTHLLPDDSRESELIALLRELSEDAAVHGILLQLPLPKHIDQDRAIAQIAPEKDVDGLGVVSAGALFTGRRGFAPCTASSVLHLIKSTGVPIAGKNAVVVGRSIVVGKPAAMLLLAENATVTLCHSRTVELAEYTRRADILVAAVGKAGLITGSMVKEDALVVDAGINRVGERTVGDVNFASVEPVAGYISPVPGGVGPVTRKILLQNTLTAAERANGN